MNDFSGKHFSVDARKIVRGAIYLILIGVVIYGMNNHVYDGFGKAVPWVIMVLFAFMGAVRIFEGVTGKNMLECIRGFLGADEGENDGDKETGADK